MLLFNSAVCRFVLQSFYISKHLMLLFNRLQHLDPNQKDNISKHLMLLFNRKCRKDLYSQDNISKHLMLLFNPTILRHFLIVFFKKTTILCAFPLFFPSARLIYCFSKKVHISAISNTFSGNHLVKFCTFKYQ